MKTLVSFHALTAALAASLGLQACGGESTGGDEGADTGGRAGTGGDVGQSGGGTQGVTGGKTGTGGVEATGGSGVTGGKSSAIRACENPMPLTNGRGEPTGLESCASGGPHRVAAVECSISVPREEYFCEGDLGGVDTCETDADCMDGPYGTCGAQGQVGGCGCSYGCRTDDDCENGGVCVCGGLAGYCVPASCRTDEDCDEGFECRSFQDGASSLCEEQRFECQTADDACMSSSECSPGTESCVADSAGVHRCRSFECGIPGRPFWIDGELRTANAARRRDWAGDGTATSCESLSPEDRAALASYFTRAALLEHASVAAFARFALELLHFGAPLELIRGAQRAMGEELEHAELCFGLASRYAGDALGPSALNVTGCLVDLSLESALRSAVREGCVGETVAAVQAAEAFEHALDADVRTALSRIRRDEWEHAQLSFRFVRWALEIDASLAGAVLEELERCAPAAAASRAITEADRRRAEHGLLPEAHLAEIAGRVHTQVVVPLLASLVGELRDQAA